MSDFNQITDSEETQGKDEFTTRVISLGEVEEVFYKLIDKQHWNVTLSKFRAQCEFYPLNSFVTIKKETNEVIACTTTIPTRPNQCVLGNVVVKEGHRNRGHGTRIVKHVMRKHTHDTVTLKATLPVHTFYSQLGFQKTDSPINLYFIKVKRAKVQKAYSESQIECDKISVELYNPKMMEALKSYDRNARGYDCGKYLSIMVGTSNHFLVATSRTSGHVVGYAAAVDQADLLWIDGMYADTDIIALSIFRKILELYPHKEQIRIHTIKPREFLTQFGDVLPKSLTFLLMSTGTTAPVSISKLYAVPERCA